ncbi:hypothetical protein C3747_55g129 [Trypanosoma cruzi]|uniref:Uncharacterized protein n=2 Tax=Trypanosoma cruzi TaxID=5693 RepID=Q4DWH0_TRYCC|nr:hypothetical protein, conserved [Trypanosoma cruzi]EAN96880.1 hypothetical protein, conserved [Trypanosoma cruzi]PWV11978.1 hypothetical protein C3747_55g129 [Trypanosoma cruzi]|eukprot:XP_818731.1 hypothetical protein [Trypanosoma cruzi strain CL Brener]
MESLLRRLQTVADVNDDDIDSLGVLEEEEEELHNMPTDRGELQRRLRHALSRVRRASERWEALQSESCKIEFELAALRQRFITSRKTWLLVHQFDRKTIEVLLKERFNAESKGQSVTLDGNGNRRNVKHGTDSLSHDITYLSSLQEQTATLKELLCKYAEERDKYKLEAQKLRASQGTQGTLSEGGPIAALGKNSENSPFKEDSTLQDYVEQLEVELRRQSEAMSEMELQRRVHGVAWEDTRGEREAQLQPTRKMERELVASQKGEDAGNGGALSSFLDSTEFVKINTMESSCESTAPVAMKRRDGDVKVNLSLDPTSNAVEELLKRLEESRAESNAREEALNALYEDVHFLRERNTQLEQQLADVDAQLEQLRLDMMMTQDECRLEKGRNRELMEQLECMQQQLQRQGRELVSANEEKRRLRLQASFPSSCGEVHRAFLNMNSLPNVTAHGSAESVSGCGRGNVRNGKQIVDGVVPSMHHDVGRTPWGGVKSGGWLDQNRTFRGFMFLIGRRRRLIIGLFVSLFIAMALIMQARLGAPVPDVVLSQLQSDLRACQTQLRLRDMTK